MDILQRLLQQTTTNAVQLLEWLAQIWRHLYPNLLLNFRLPKLPFQILIMKKKKIFKKWNMWYENIASMIFFFILLTPQGSLKRSPPMTFHLFPYLVAIVFQTLIWFGSEYAPLPYHSCGGPSPWKLCFFFFHSPLAKNALDTVGPTKSSKTNIPAAANRSITRSISSKAVISLLKSGFHLWTSENQRKIQRRD